MCARARGCLHANAFVRARARPEHREGGKSLSAAHSALGSSANEISQ